MDGAPVVEDVGEVREDVERRECDVLAPIPKRLATEEECVEEVGEGDEVADDEATPIMERLEPVHGRPARRGVAEAGREEELR